MFGGGEDKKIARPAVTDQGGVQLLGSGAKLFVVDSDAEVVDLISEGAIEGLVSGTWNLDGIKGETGFQTSGFTPYFASGADGTENTSLGFLQSIYWNDTPIVDQNHYYNFTNINVEYTKGEPQGSIAVANLNPNLPTAQTMDLSVERPIGERLYGVSIQGGTLPTVTESAELVNDSRIDAVAKTYTIVNKECTQVQVRIKVTQLMEQIRNDEAPKTTKEGKRHADVGYGDVKARSIKYKIWYQPVFDAWTDSTSTADGRREEIIPANKWELGAEETIKGNISDVYIRSTTITFQSPYTSVPGFSGWRIKIIRLTPESLTSYLKSVSHVDSLVEIYGTKLRYPYSAMVYSRFDAEFFSRIPTRSYDTKLQKVKIPNNYNPVKKSYGRSDAIIILPTGWPNCSISTKLREGQLVYFQSGGIMKVGTQVNPSDSTTIPGGSTWLRGGTHGAIYGNHQYPVALEQGSTVDGFGGSTDDDHFWDGGFKQIDYWPDGADVPFPDPALVEKEWTDNPAWCFYDLITNPRYGLGDFVEASQLDKWTLYDISQYCDVLVPDGYGYLEPRFTMNHLIVSREEAYKVLNEMVSVFRGMLYYSNGLIHAVQDAFKDPIYQFNNANVIDGEFTYSSSSKKARHSVAVVRYIDKKTLYTPAIEYVEDEESIKRYGIRQIETTALGCTSRGQARRFGQWMLASEAQETESVAFGVGQDGAYIRPGDVVQIYDQFRTPLNFAGRTNVVSALGPAPSYINYSSDIPANQNGTVTGNSIIIDNAVYFDDNSVYKFSLLTPTYDYGATGITDMDSSGAKEIRRSQIQDLYFLGHHTETVSGYYNSNYQEGGSGIATKIYFHTGLIMADGNPIGTGNQLDFENYVITGYTNDYVQGPDGDIVESYSGGCFSGENLVWSVENNDPEADQYVSGSFSSYRIINIAENDQESSYSVQALAYSTGKYDEVEDRLAFQNPLIQDPPQWPYILDGGTKKVADSTKIIRGNPDMQELKNGMDPSVDGNWEDKNEKEKSYPTMELTIPQAALRLNEFPTRQGGKDWYGIDTAADSIVKESMTYQIAVSPVDDINQRGFGDPSGPQLSDFNDDSTILRSISDLTFGQYYAPNLLYQVNGNPDRTTQGTGADKGDAIPKEGSSQTASLFFFERPLIQDKNYWIAIFAFNNRTRSEEAIIGLIPSSTFVKNVNGGAVEGNKIQTNPSLTAIQGIEIFNLTSPDFVGADTGTGTEKQNELNELTSNQPSFTWTVGQDIRFKDNWGNQILYPQDYMYRITVRKYDESQTKVSKPSSDVYIELTGQEISEMEPAFVFLESYNNPNTIENLAYNPDVIRYDKCGNSGNLSNGLVSVNNTEWYRENNTGIVFKNDSASFPLRKFDLVVEAHDIFGNTSAGNKVWDNTIGFINDGTCTKSTSAWAKGGEANEGEGYDNYPGNLAIPSGIVFAQGWGDENVDLAADNKSLKDYAFLTPAQGFSRGYPYVASAAVYNDGQLKLSIVPSVDAAGNRVLSDSSLARIFNDAAGIVYYYSTGDNSLIDSVPENGEIRFLPNNKAPYFDFYPLTAETPVGNYNETTVGIAGSKAFGYQGAVTYSKYDPSNPSQSAGTATWGYVSRPQGWGKDPDDFNIQTYRSYVVFDGAVDISDITVPFPDIADSRVQNIYLNVGLFDSLSFLQHFNSDGTPKTVLINNESATKSKKSGNGEGPGFPAEHGNQLIPTILLDPNINFSTLPTDTFLPRNADGTRTILNWNQIYDGIPFLHAAGTPIFLKERSLITDSQSALAYRAWFDVAIDPGEYNLDMDFDGVNEKNKKKKYRGPFRLEKYREGGSFKYRTVKFSQKNKLKGISHIQFRTTLEVKNSLYRDGAFPVKGLLTLFFEQDLDPDQYVVEVDFNGANAATANKKIRENDRTVKITDSIIPHAQGESNMNPNKRDFFTNDYPLPNCALVKKSRRFVQFEISSFMIEAFYGELAEAMMSGKYEWVTRVWTPGNDYFREWPERGSQITGKYVKANPDDTSDNPRLALQIVTPIDAYYPLIPRGKNESWWEGTQAAYITHYQDINFKEKGTGFQRTTRLYWFGYLRNRQTKETLIINDRYVYGHPKDLGWAAYIYHSTNVGTSATTQGHYAIGSGGEKGLLIWPTPKADSAKEDDRLKMEAGKYLSEARNLVDVSFADNKTHFLGNIIHVRGGILLSDKTNNSTQ